MPIPVILWGQDPLFSSFRKLLISSIHSTVENDRTEEDSRYEFYLHKRALQKVEVLGVITSKVVRSKRVLLNVDDGTGVIECSKLYNSAENEPTPLVEFRLGDLVSIRGTLAIAGEPSRFVVHITYAARELDPNEEPLHWLRAMELMDTVYRQPFVPHLTANDNAAKRSTMTIGCACGVDDSVKQRLLFCRCTASHIIPPGDPKGLLAAALLQMLCTTFEDALPVNKRLTLSRADILGNATCRALVGDFLVRRERQAQECEPGDLGDLKGLQAGTWSCCVEDAEYDGLPPRSKRGRLDTSSPSSTSMEERVLAVTSTLNEILGLIVKDGALMEAHDNMVLMSLERVLLPTMETVLDELGATELTPRVLVRLRTEAPGVPKWRWEYLREEQRKDEEGSWGGDSDSDSFLSVNGSAEDEKKEGCQDQGE